MTWTLAEQRRISAIEDRLSSLITVLENLATRRELKSLVALSNREIYNLEAEINHLREIDTCTLVGPLNATQIIGDIDNKVPDNAISSSSVTQHLVQEIGSTTENISLIINREDGPYHTIAEALITLPKNIDHIVALKHPEGDFIVTPDYFGNLARFNYGPYGKIIIQGINNITTRVLNTSEYLVNSAIEREDYIVLQDNPNFVQNQYSGYYMRVLSGPGSIPGTISGDCRPIRDHNDNLFNIAGRWRSTDNELPNNTSTIEICSPSVRFILENSNDKTFVIQGEGYKHTHSGYGLDSQPQEESPTIIFQGIEFIKGTTVNSLLFNEINIEFDRCKIFGLTVLLDAADVFIDKLIVDGNGAIGYALLTLYGFSRIRHVHDAAALLIRNFNGYGSSYGGGHGIYLLGVSKGPATITNGLQTAIDNVAGNAIEIYGRLANLQFVGSGFRGTNIAGHSIHIRDGARATIDGSSYHWTDVMDNGPIGDLGSVNIDETIYSWNDIDNIPTKYIHGSKGSVFGIVTNATAGYKLVQSTGNNIGQFAIFDSNEIIKGINRLSWINNTLADTEAPLNLGTETNSLYGLGIGDILIGGQLEISSNLFINGTCSLSNLINLKSLDDGKLQIINSNNDNFNMAIFGLATNQGIALKKVSQVLQIKLGDDSNWAQLQTSVYNLVNGQKILGGGSDPEGVIAASPGSIYLRTLGGPGTTFYVKESGIGNTGWQAK